MAGSKQPGEEINLCPDPSDSRGDPGPPGEQMNLCPVPYRTSRTPCPQCCSREFATHWCAICTDHQGIFSTTSSSMIDMKFIRKSATRESGKCRRCVLILACLKHYVAAGLDNEIWIQTCPIPSLSLQEGKSTGTSYNKGCLVRLRIGTSIMNIEVFVLPNTTSPWRGIGAAPELSHDTSSRKSLEHARKWLTDCRKHHKQCNHPKVHHRPLPTRLIDVLSNQEGGPVRLIETSSTQEGHYLCLSHCWGDPERHPHPLKTEKRSLERHKEGISWRSLPKAFQDAISFVRLLGESYIWIDSLCIIQDCPDDWHQEASKMADVYTNSYLTLAATKSTNSAESLFSTLDDKYKSYPHSVEENGSTYTLYFRKSLSHWFDEWDDATEPPPLLQRAWVYQERVLSPRTLHFGNQELLWECKEVTTCECGLWVDSDFNNTCPRADILPRKSEDTKEESGTTSIWQRVVEKYSSLKLTKESDRLPAIAGIAKRLQFNRGGGDYLAGLWRESLLEDLIWERSPRNPPGFRDTSVAPSWSWVCIKGGVDFWGRLKISNRVAYLVDAKVQSDQHDVFMKASSGSITIKGYLFAARKPDDGIDPVLLALEPPSPVTVASSDKFADKNNINCWKNSLQSLKRENSATVCIGGALIYSPDELINSTDELPDDSRIRYLLTHAGTGPLNESFFLALRPKEDRYAFERIGLLMVEFDVDSFRRTFQPDQMQTVTIV